MADLNTKLDYLIPRYLELDAQANCIVDKPIRDADCLLQDMMDDFDIEESFGLSKEIIDVVQKSYDKESVCKMFEVITGVPLVEWLENSCLELKKSIAETK